MLSFFRSVSSVKREELTSELNQDLVEKINSKADQIRSVSIKHKAESDNFDLQLRDEARAVDVSKYFDGSIFVAGCDDFDNSYAAINMNEVSCIMTDATRDNQIFARLYHSMLSYELRKAFNYSVEWSVIVSLLKGFDEEVCIAYLGHSPGRLELIVDGYRIDIGVKNPYLTPRIYDALVRKMSHHINGTSETWSY